MKTELNLPPDLAKLSPDAKIVSIDVDSVNYINITSRFVKVDGDATIYVMFPSAVDSDTNEGFPMHFKAIFVADDNKLSFMKIQEYSIDTSD